MGCSKGAAGKQPGNPWNIAPDVDRETYLQLTTPARLGESAECYLGRAGNSGNDQAPIGENPDKIETISIPVRCDLSVDTQMKPTKGTPSVASGCVTPGNFLWIRLGPPNGTAYTDPNAEYAGNSFGGGAVLMGSDGKFSGAYDSTGLGKTFAFVVVMYCEHPTGTFDYQGKKWKELDRKPYKQTPVECKPGMGIKFIHPLPGSVVTSKCSVSRKNPATGVVRPHKGCDFAYAGGRVGPVLASADGEVCFAGVQNGYGNIVIIGHKDAAGKRVCITKYAHLASIGVSVGQKVAAGDKIGVEGNTGIGTGNHLHFEIRGGTSQGDQVFDPLEYIGGSMNAQTTNSDDPGQPAGPTENKNNKEAPVTAQANQNNNDCNYKPDYVPPEADNAALPVPDNSDKFTKCFNLTMTEEVGSWWNPADAETQQGLCDTPARKRKTGYVVFNGEAGGLTKFGLSQPNQKTINVTTCTMDQAKSVYENKYWKYHKCDELYPASTSAKTNAVWFDACMQHGGCRIILARAVGKPEGTNISVLISAANAMGEQQFVDALTQERLKYVSSCKVAKSLPAITQRPGRVKSKAMAL